MVFIINNQKGSITSPIEGKRKMNQAKWRSRE